MRVLYEDEFDQNSQAINYVFDTYTTIANEGDYFIGASGKQAMEQIIESGAVVKELHGHHIEETIVINYAEGTTLDQQYFTRRVKEMSVDKPRIIQAFTVDVWRGKKLAEIVTSIATENNPQLDPSYAYQTAMADFLIRTLAVAATLTSGDLPVYRRRTK